MSADNSYVIRASDATTCVNPNGNVALTGNSDVAERILIDGSHLYVQPNSPTSSSTLVLDQSMSSEFGSDSHGINAYGRQGGNSHLTFYNGITNSVCNVLTDGTLDVGKLISLQRHPTESDTTPLIINDSSSSGAGFIGKVESTVKGCLFEYLTSASSTSWWQGVLGGSNEFVLKTGSNGLTFKANGSAVLSSSLTQNSDASLKYDVEDVGFIDCMNMLDDIHVKTYTRNDMEEGNKRLGLIAQDATAYLPDKSGNIIGSDIITDEQG